MAIKILVSALRNVQNRCLKLKKTSLVDYIMCSKLNLPDNIVDANNVLFFSVLRGTDDGGTGLHPGVTTKFVHYPIVVRQDLTLVHY